jgi:hypothetical protein
MSVAFVLAPLVCGVVLLVSGLAKLRDAPATEAAFAAMPVPEVLRSRAVIRALPVVELVLGALLVLTWGWVLAAVSVLAVAMFVVYWVLVLVVLRRGEPVDCGCFGSVGDDRVTGSTLARNTVLLVLAGVAVAFGSSGDGFIPVLRDLSTSDAAWLVMTAATVAAAVLVVGIGRTSAPAEPVPDEDLEDYERAPIPFALLEDARGRQATLRLLASDGPQLLVFLSSHCCVCVEVASQVLEWQSRLDPDRIQLVFIEDLAQLPETVTPPGIPAWHDVERGATDVFAPRGRPAAVLLGSDGLLAGGPVAGAPDVAAFVDDVIAELEAASAPNGERPQPVEDGLHDLSGHDLSGHDPSGHDLGGHDHTALEEHEHEHQH